MMRLTLLAALIAASIAAPGAHAEGGAVSVSATQLQNSTVSDAVRAVEQAVQAEMTDKAVPSMAVALVDRSGVIWSGAWGKANEARTVSATPATLYRAGSVSKLFTDFAIMRLVEQGKVDLDAPVTRYLPDFRPDNPFGTPITLRQLMTHRSGIVREPPRGNYFDDKAKGQSDTVASLNGTRLVAAPGTVTKYSNAAVAVVGEVVARVVGRPFEEAVEELVLRPLGMNASGFGRNALNAPVAYGQMASFDGGRWPAPPIELGTPAAGNLYSNVDDLGRFVCAMLNRGVTAQGRVLIRPSTLDAMWRPQYPEQGTSNFGLGFSLSTLDGQRTVGHGGAVYGYTTDLRMMPDAGIGAIVFSTVDLGPSARRIGIFALRTLLAARQGASLPTWQRSEAIGGELARRLSGRYVSGSDSANLRIFDDRLVLDAPEVAGELRKTGDRFVLDDAQLYRDDLSVAPDAAWLELGGRRFTRASTWSRPAPPEAELASLIGEYGWDYNVMRIYERDGKPYVRIEWTDWLPLERIAPDRYAFPKDRGLYKLESLRFERDAKGQVTAAMLGAIRFPRRDFGAEALAAIRAVTNTGIPVLRAQAREATPPPEPVKPTDLIDVQSVAPGIRLDVRYASSNNFMGQPMYERPGAFMQRPAAQALARIHQALAGKGFGLLIHDAYRPWYVTKMFWDATPPAYHIFVADPSQGSRHNRGAAVDLTMIDLKTGQPIVTTGRYDEFSSRSYSNYVGGSDEQRWLREVLRNAMENDGFSVYPQEWWHFDFHGWRDYPIGNATFDQLDRNKSKK